MLSAEINLKESVVTALGTQNRAHLLGVHRERDCFPFAAIKDGGNLPGQAKPSCFVLAARGAGCSFDDNLLLEPYFLPFVTILLRGVKARPTLQFPIAWRV